MTKKLPNKKSVETIRYNDAKRKNIPTAEHQSVIEKGQEAPRTLKYPRNTRSRSAARLAREGRAGLERPRRPRPAALHPGKGPPQGADRRSAAPDARTAQTQEPGIQTDLFADFNGIPEGVDKTEFYQHDQNWSNRMILGDSLQVMASLAEREGLRGKVQCIYFDPPYGIKFNSNFQWSTTSRDVKDGNADHITREPEQVKAFRDTWRDGIHSYLTYLRDRLTVARDLLTDSGSIFVQIGDENVHRVRAVMDEVFGDENFCRQIIVHKTTGSTAARLLANDLRLHSLVSQRISDQSKYRPTLSTKASRVRTVEDRYDSWSDTDGSTSSTDAERVRRPASTSGRHESSVRHPITSQRPAQGADSVVSRFEGKTFHAGGTVLEDRRRQD